MTTRNGVAAFLLTLWAAGSVPVGHAQVLTATGSSPNAEELGIQELTEAQRLRVATLDALLRDLQGRANTLSTTVVSLTTELTTVLPARNLLGGQCAPENTFVGGVSGTGAVQCGAVTFPSTTTPRLGPVP